MQIIIIVIIIEWINQGSLYKPEARFFSRNKINADSVNSSREHCCFQNPTDERNHILLCTLQPDMEYNICATIGYCDLLFSFGKHIFCPFSVSGNNVFIDLTNNIDLIRSLKKITELNWNSDNHNKICQTALLSLDLGQEVFWDVSFTRIVRIGWTYEQACKHSTNWKWLLLLLEVDYNH